MSNENLKGKRYLNLVRCSSDPQTETSIPTQLEGLNNWAAERGMVHAGDDADIILDGVSGSKPGNRSDFAELIARKQTRNDFEIVLCYVEDRFSRGGPDHAGWAQYELLRHGIKVIYPMSDIPEGEYASLLKLLKFQAAQETVKNTSLRSTQGYQRALGSNKVSASSQTPYGLYRLYVNEEGKRLFIIRNMRDGTQRKLHAETRQLLETLGRVGGKSAGHFRKEKSDMVFLVSGEASEVEAVQRIFRRRYLDGVGGRRLANELNAAGILSPKGRRWNQRLVDSIAENPAYCGWGISGRSSSARFYQRHRDNPQPVEVDPTIVANRKYLPVRLRPPAQWTIQQHPHLADFLPEPLNGIASASIQKVWEERCRHDRPLRVINTHSDSEFVLTGLLRAKQDGRLLKGQNSGPKRHKVRYYVHGLAQKDPKAAGFPNTTFNAEALEKPVLKTLVEVLAATDLRPELLRIVETLLSRQPAIPDADISELQAQKVAISRKIALILEVVDDAGAPEAKAKIAQLRQEQRAVEKRIQQAAADRARPAGDPDAIVDSLVQRLNGLANGIDGMPTYQLRQVLAALIDSITADMLTREVEMALRVPPAAFQQLQKGLAALCLEDSSWSSASLQEQRDDGLVWVVIRCRFTRKNEKPCFNCMRLRPAA